MACEKDEVLFSHMASQLSLPHLLTGPSSPSWIKVFVWSQELICVCKCLRTLSWSFSRRETEMLFNTSCRVCISGVGRYSVSRAGLFVFLYFFFFLLSIHKTLFLDLGCSLLVEHLPRTWEALDSSLSTINK